MYRSAKVQGIREAAAVQRLAESTDPEQVVNVNGVEKKFGDCTHEDRLWMVREADLLRAARHAVVSQVSPEEHLFRAVSEAPGGLTLQEAQRVLGHLNKDDREMAIRSARQAAWCTESRESRPNASGRPQQQVVLRLKAS